VTWSKLGNFWKTVLAGGAGMAALAAVNASIQRKASEPDDTALGGEGRLFRWKHGRIFYKELGLQNSGVPIVFRSWDRCWYLEFHVAKELRCAQRKVPCLRIGSAWGLDSRISLLQRTTLQIFTSN
jgi:hypothetical protein